MLKKWIQLNSILGKNQDKRLKKAKLNVAKQAGLAVFTITVTLILVFSMTAAWHTNVVSTGGLSFQAESWGFEGGVTVNEDIIEAAPGDEGFVSMQITNTGEKASSVSVNISKQFMQDTQMQQRIYFYADKASVINGENVERIYLSNAGGYTYYLPARNALVLSEETYTDVRLKWEWVYDVVGYYFCGTQDGSAFTVDEYLRPVMYSYDDAQYDETTGELLKVDGETSVAVFLADITAKDGFVGAYTVGTEANTGKSVLMQNNQPVTKTLDCYPIDTENNIWLYLCTKQDIQHNTAWDTEYGMTAQAEQPSCQARITVTGQQLAQEAVQVGNQSALEQMLSENTGDVITLSQDIILDSPLTVSGDILTVLDLNGHEITTTHNTVFQVDSGAALTVMDGSVSGDGTTVFKSVGGQITMSNLQVSGVHRVLEVNDYQTKNESGDNSVIRISDSHIQAESATILITGDGTASERKTALIIENSTVESGYIAISGNGTATNPGRWGTEIQIYDSVITGLYAGIYQPQMQSHTLVKNSEISGWTGIAIKGGNVTVVDSKVTGTGKDTEVVTPTVSNISKSGFVDTGDGIYVESTYEYPISITVSGDSTIACTAQSAQAVRVFPAAEHVRLFITSGTFTTDVSSYLEAGYVCTGTQNGYVVAAEETD